MTFHSREEEDELWLPEWTPAVRYPPYFYEIMHLNNCRCRCVVVPIGIISLSAVSPLIDQKSLRAAIAKVIAEIEVGRDESRELLAAMYGCQPDLVDDVVQVRLKDLLSEE